MTLRLDMLCHPSTSAMRASAFPGNEPLDAQARRKLAALPHPLRADHCLSSPALRALQTAEALGFAATVEPRLRDCDYGRWAGRSLDDVQAQEPQAVLDWLQDPMAAPHGGESVLALIERVASWLDSQAVRSGRVVAVTHAAVIRAAIIRAIDAEPRSFGRIDVAPLSLTRLSRAHGAWRLTSLGAIKVEPREEN